MFSQSPDLATKNYAEKLLAKQTNDNVETQATSPSYHEAMLATEKKLQFNTTQGDFTIQLLPDAPFTAWHFVNNVQTGFYSGSYFNRVIGNFVAQGGDPIGDGSGSSGQTIREEISFQKHLPMTVGMATAGKDTGTSQFFINTGRNLHLDRNYTVFGKVISGQDKLMKMTHGAQLLKVEIIH